MKADFVVLSKNPLEVDPMKIKDIEVEATVMNGRITHFQNTKGIYTGEVLTLLNRPSGTG